MSKGGTQRTVSEVKLPPELVEAAKRNLKLADNAAGIGPVMYNGPSVAGFSPMQLAAMQGTDQAASAFGMPSAVNWQQGRGGAMVAPRSMSGQDMYRALTGIQAPNSSAGGFSGYNTLPIAQQAIRNLPAAQRAAIESFSMNPVTGARPANPIMPAQAMANPSKQTSTSGQAQATAQRTAAQRLRERMQRLQEERMWGGNR